jgi:membrane associated rhomboid family serine protease
MLFPLYDLNPHRRFPWITLAIIGINVAVMAWMFGLDEPSQQAVALRYGFVPARLTHLGEDKPVVAPVWEIDPLTGRQRKLPDARLSTSPADVYSTFLTTMFLHGGWFHLISNMWMLWVFGNNIEDRLGHLMYLGYYLVGGIVATLCHWFAASDGPNSLIPVVGASGAVAAVLGGYALTYPTAKVRTLVFFFLILIVDLPALLLLGIWFALQVASGVLGMMALDIAAQPVAFFAHIGGFVAGMVLMPLLSLGTPPPGTDWRKESDDMFRFDDPRRSELDKETGRQGDWENR